MTHDKFCRADLPPHFCICPTVAAIRADEREQAARERHYKGYYSGGDARCEYDWQDWPCETIRNLRAAARGEDARCALCGHVRSTACGYGQVDEKYLCHADDHDCYTRWTLHGERRKDAQ